MPDNQTSGTGWVEVSIHLPVAIQEAVIAWAIAHGAVGVQEEYPGLGDLGESGPIVSGDPAEWSGDAPPNPGDRVFLKAWFPATGFGARIREAFRDYLSGLPGGQASELQARRVEDADWAEALRREWRPIEVGHRFLVCPSFVRVPRASGRIVLKLRPGMAFGTGTHFTTASCVRMVEDIMASAPDPVNVRVLDVGTGSGVLAIAALLLGAGQAVGLDLDRDALREARQNARLNHVSDRFRTPRGPLDPERMGRFSLVLANLVAATLQNLAVPLVRSLAPGGRLVVSGILSRQEDEILRTFGSRGLVPVATMRDGTWVTIALDSNSRA